MFTVNLTNSIHITETFSDAYRIILHQIVLADLVRHFVPSGRACTDVGREGEEDEEEDEVSHSRVKLNWRLYAVTDRERDGCC